MSYGRLRERGYRHDMELFFGVPAHPFFVHAPIVLLPIAAIATVVVAARPMWNVRALPWLSGATAVVVVMLFMAIRSGQALADVANGRAISGDVTDHERLGQQTLIISIVWLVALIAAVVLGRRQQAPTALSADAAAPSAFAQPAQILTVIAAVVSIVATIWLIRTGHSGAESHWVGVINLIENS